MCFSLEVLDVRPMPKLRLGIRTDGPPTQRLGSPVLNLLFIAQHFDGLEEGVGVEHEAGYVDDGIHITEQTFEVVLPLEDSEALCESTAHTPQCLVLAVVMLVPWHLELPLAVLAGYRLPHLKDLVHDAFIDEALGDVELEVGCLLRYR